MKTPKKTPKSELRRQNMLEAALELFLKNGYHKTGLLEIIKKSGGSLGTLYDAYGSKEGMLKALIQSKAITIVSSLEENAAKYANYDLKEFLLNMARDYVRLAKDKKAIDIKSIVIQDSKNEQVANLFYELAIKPIFRLFTDYFSRPEISAQLVDADYDLLTFRFFNLLEEPLRSWGKVCALMFDDESILKQDDEWIKQSVEFFINGVTKR